MDPASTEPATAQAGVVSSESSTLSAFNLAARAEELRVNRESRDSEAEGNKLQKVTARELEADRHGQAVVTSARIQPSVKLKKDFKNLPGSVTRKTLAAIASCESGGDPEVVSSNGLYHGKYQFSPGTWESVGGHGLPSKAPEAEQDYRAALLYKRSGPGQWPVCGQ